MQTTDRAITQNATCGGCGKDCSIVWPAGLTEGIHTNVTRCPCGRGHDWTLRVSLTY